MKAKQAQMHEPEKPKAKSSETLWHRLHNKDARDILSIIPRNSIDLILTSPPYAALKDYEYKGQIGFGQDINEYLQNMRAVLESCFEVAKPTATLWLISDVFKSNGKIFNLPAELAQCASNVGWKLQEIIIWHKTKTLPWSHKGRLRKIFEYIHVFSKTKQHKYHQERIREIEGLQQWWVKYPERYDPLGKTPHNIWHFQIPTQGSWSNGEVRHFNPFPTALVERIIELTTDPGDVVLDPFAGTGTVIAQAECMRRNAAGMELNPHFVNRLFPKVRAEVKKEWENRRQTREERRQKTDRFDSLILRMRKVKLSKLVVKSVTQLGMKNTDTLQVLAGITVSNGAVSEDTLPPHKLDHLNLLLVANGPASFDAILRRAQDICTRPPLSKYGLQVYIRVVSPRDWNDGLPGRTTSSMPFFIYPAGTSHVHEGCINTDNIQNFLDNPQGSRWIKRNIPPIFSDIRSDIRISREEINRFLI